MTSADRTLSIAGLSPAYKAVLLVFRRVYRSLHWVRRLHDVPLLRPGPTRPHAPLLHLEAATELHSIGSATACLTGFCQHFHCHSRHWSEKVQSGKPGFWRQAGSRKGCVRGGKCCISDAGFTSRLRGFLLNPNWLSGRNVDTPGCCSGPSNAWRR